MFQSLRRDSVTGNYYARYRDYNAPLGRWMTIDPIMYSAGDVNLFRFISNSYLNYTDPYGLQKKMLKYACRGFSEAESKQLLDAIRCAFAALQHAKEMLEYHWDELGVLSKTKVGDNVEIISPSYKKLNKEIPGFVWNKYHPIGEDAIVVGMIKVKDHILKSINKGLDLLQNGSITCEADRSPPNAQQTGAYVIYTLGFPGSTVYITETFWKSTPDRQCDIIKHEIGRLVGWGGENTGNLADDVYEWDNITDWLASSWKNCPSCRY